MKKSSVKRIASALSVISGAAVVGSGLFACTGGVGAGKSTLLAKPQAVVELPYDESNTDGFKVISKSAADFAARFSGAAYSEFGADKNNNIAVSPISAYMALSLAARCTDGDTRAEILSALGVSYELMESELKNLYRSLNIERRSNTGDLSALVELGNSIWLDKSANANKICLESLANDYYCYSYSADFARDNDNANLAVRSFVRERTHKLIDIDFDLSPSTVFALINTLYLKDVWNEHGDDIELTNVGIDFLCDDGKITNKRFIDGYYCGGRAYTSKSGEFTSFFTSTHGGHRINFIVPSDGYTVDDVFTAENIAEMSAITDYGEIDTENKIYYHTNCVFPMFDASFDEDVRPLLEKNMNVRKMFDPVNADYSPITDGNGVACSRVRHVAKLKVDRKGIEGAAVTVEAMDGSAAPIDKYKDVYETFTVDRAFGFTITDYYGTTLFSGVVKKI